MIETYLLEQFIAVGKYGTLLAASEELHISQPSLSRSMKKLEDELGVNLFVRENNRISLNESGKLALDYAIRAMQANQEMIDRVRAFDRSLNMISVGACAPFPVNELMPILQEHFFGKAITSKIDGDDRLTNGLKEHEYHLTVLHQHPTDKDLFCQRYFEEQLYIMLSEEHPLAGKESVSFDDLRGTRILLSGSIGFWMDLCLEKLNPSDLFVQTNPDALTELIEVSGLPFFNSDQMIKRGYQVPGRKPLLISDPEAHVTYYLACLASERKKFDSLFNAIRAEAIHS